MIMGEPGGVVWVEAAELDGGLRGAMWKVLPAGTTFGFNYDGGKAWVEAYGVDTVELVDAARRRLEQG